MNTTYKNPYKKRTIDLQPVIRCKNCKYFLPLNAENRDTIFDGLYMDYPWNICEEIGADGLCINTDKWQEAIGFCSDAISK